MYARITRVQAPPDRLDDIAKAFVNDALPALRALRGYAGSSLAVDRASGDGQAVTFWESREALESSEQAATGIRTETTQAGGGQVASVQRLEVALMERVAPASRPAFLRVIRTKADPARLDALLQAVRDQAIPAVRPLTGFRALVVSLDRDAGDVVVTAVYATAADREEADRRMADIRNAVLAAGGADRPEISLYEVLAVEFVGVGAAASA